jgi:hypothetical protein
MAKQIKIQQTPNLVGRPSAQFENEAFAALIQQKGYDVVIESAVRCPCRTKENDHLSTCQNCLGTGWVFLNPVQDRAVLSSINSSTQFKDWSQENMGTVNVSLQSRTFLSFMDKVKVLDAQTVHSQLLYPQNFNGTYFAYTIYDILSVIEVFRFVSATSMLQRLVEGTDFTIDRNKIIFSSVPASDFTVSVRYYHNPVYGVIDIPHIIRNSYRKANVTGREELQILPVNGVARLWHYMVDGLNFIGNNVFDNSYQEV